MHLKKYLLIGAIVVILVLVGTLCFRSWKHSRHPFTMLDELLIGAFDQESNPITYKVEFNTPWLDDTIPYPGAIETVRVAWNGANKTWPLHLNVYSKEFSNYEIIKVYEKVGDEWVLGASYNDTRSFAYISYHPVGDDLSTYAFVGEGYGEYVWEYK